MQSDVEIIRDDDEGIPCPIVLLRGEMLTEEVDGLYRVTTKENAISDILTVRLACGVGDAATFSGSRLYYEARVESGGAVVLGLAGPGFDEGVETQPERPGVGDVMPSWAFDGSRRRKRTRQISDTYGQRWKAGDMVGVLLDVETKEISFSLNGKDLGPAFTLNDDEVKGLYPAASLHFGDAVVFNFGRAPFEYNPRQRESTTPIESKAIPETVQVSRPKTRRKSGAANSSTKSSSKSPSGSKTKRRKEELMTDDASSATVAERAHKVEKNGHISAERQVPYGGDHSTECGVTENDGAETAAREEAQNQVCEIDRLLKHESLLEGMHEVHARHIRERKALLVSQRKEVQKYFQRRGGPDMSEDLDMPHSADEGKRESKRSRTTNGSLEGQDTVGGDI